MTSRHSDAVTTLLWIALLTAASSLTTWVLACATPFAALAALAAVHMRREDGLKLVGMAWMASQIVGFAIHDYSRDPRTLAWACGIGIAAILSALAANAVLTRLEGHSLPMRMAGAFGAAFVGYNTGLAICALGLGGIGITLDPFNLARQFLRNAGILIGLLGLYRGLIGIGLPAPRRSPAAV